MNKLLIAISAASALVTVANAETYTVPANTVENVTSENVADYNAYDEGITVPSTAGLDFSGPGTMSFTAPVTVSSGGSLVISNGADVVLGAQSISLGGDMMITNATLRPATPTWSTTNWDKVLAVGAGGRGFLRIEEGALVTNRLELGKDYATGIVVQNGGTVVNLGGKESSDAEKNRTAVGRGGNGYYEQHGGTNTVIGVLSLAASYKGHGVYALYDGLFEGIKGGSATETMLLFYGGDEPAAYYQFGGTAKINARLNVWTYYSVFSVAGLNSVFDGSVTAGYVNPTYGVIVAPAAVTFSGGAVMKGSMTLSSEDSIYKGALQAAFNFNDATVQAQGSWGNLIGASRPISARYVVYAGGVTLDPNGYSTVVANSIRGASGNGVTNIVWNKDTTYSACPVVVIKETGGGNGYGASAVPKYDPVTKKVTDIVIVSPGCDYTEATAYFVYGDSLEKAVTRTDIGPNPVDGGVLFKSATGTGNIYLDATGLWKGVTEVRSGKVQIRDGVLPTNTVLRLTGGTVNFYSKRVQTFRSIGGTSGALTGSPTNMYEVVSLDIDTAQTLDLSAYTLTVTGRWDIAAADLAAEKCADYNARIVFGPTATINVSDLGDFGEKRVLARAAKGMTGVPTLVGAGADELKVVNWNNELVLSRRRGLLLILR